MKFQLFSLTLLAVFAFQSCGSFEGVKESQEYPYSVGTDFFYGVQMVGVSQDDAGRSVYEFDVALSYAQDPDQAVSYQVNGYDEDFGRVCQTTGDDVEGEDRHFRVVCKQTLEGAIYIELRLEGPNDESTSQTWRF